MVMIFISESYIHKKKLHFLCAQPNKLLNLRLTKVFFNLNGKIKFIRGNPF